MSDATSSKLPIWLIVSLIANALLIGVLIGGGLGQRKAGPPPSAVGQEESIIRGIDRALPDEERREVRQIFRRAFADSRDERVRVRNARRALGRLMNAEQYDAEAVRAGFEELREADAAMKARMHNLIADQFGTLSAEQRRVILRESNRADRRRGDRPPPPRDRPPPPRPSDDRN